MESLNLKLSMDLSFLELMELLEKQLNNNFILRNNKKEILEMSVIAALKKCEICFAKQNNKYYVGEHGVCFNPFHSGQYTIFLYFVSNILYLKYKNENLASRVYYLNKMLNGVDLFYAIELPNIFGVEHPVGAVMGRAKYSNYFWFYQHTTVGGNKERYPEIGEKVVLFANATIIGNSKIGSNCLISANTYIKDECVPDNTIVYGASPNLILKENRIDIINLAIEKVFKCN